jgi:hypothetical protein
VETVRRSWPRAVHPKCYRSEATTAPSRVQRPAVLIDDPHDYAIFNSIDDRRSSRARPR